MSASFGYALRGVLRLALLIAMVVCVLGLTGCDPNSMYGPLARQWSTSVPSAIVAKATVAQGSVYIGDWGNGYEYSFTEGAGTLNWKASLGTTIGNCPTGSYTQGVASSPTVLNGLAYLGGGDANWYALDTTSGSAQWFLPVGDNSPTGGNFNYSSPLIYNGFAYVGTASFCDNPLVQGKLLRVNLATHQISNVWKGVPDGQVGGTIWSNPVVDPATNTIFLTTGTRAQAGQQYAEAFVGLDATTLAVKGSWSPTSTSCTVCDFDFGASPTLFTDASGRQLVGAPNKNGVFYALDRNNLNAGPVWQTQIADGGPCPQCGDGSISTAYYDGQRLYVAGANTTINSHAYKGSVRAIDPTSGGVLWQVGLDSLVLGALTGQNGMVAVPAVSALYVLDGAKGNVLYANNLGNQIFAPAALADGHLIIGTVDGVVHTMAFPVQAPVSHSTIARIATRPRFTPRAVRLCLSGGTCRLTASPRCSTLQAPATGPTQLLEGLDARVLGRGRTGDFLRVYNNGACVGRPLLQLRLDKRPRSFRLRTPISVPDGAIVAITAPRRLRLQLHLVTHPGHVPRPPQPLRSRLPVFHSGSRH